MANIGDREDATSSATVTLAAPGQGKRWYLLDVSVRGDTAGDFTVQSPAASNIHKVSLLAQEGYEKTWAHGKRGAENSAMVIAMSGGGTFDISYTAVVR